MCGLVSIVGHLDTVHEKMFKLMLQLDTMRGADSTGMLSVSLSNATTILKGLGTPWDLSNHKKFDSFFYGYHKVLMGHNRSATRGAVSIANAHPFEFEDVIGAHNGTLRSTVTLDGHNQFNVDSEVLFHHMDVNGVDDTIEKVDGAFALTWYDKLSKTFNFVRNSERPLCYTKIEDGKILAVASEPWMLTIAAGYAGVKIGEIETVPVGELFTVHIPRGTAKVAPASQTPMEITRRALRLKLEIPVNYGGHTGNRFPAKKHTPAVPETKTRQTTGSSQQSRPSSHLSLAGWDAKFEVTGYGVSYSNQPYIAGEIVHAEGRALTDLKTTKVRVFPTKDSAKWNDMLESSNYFKGLIKNHSDFDGGFYTVALSSVQEVDATDTTQDLYQGYRGTLLTLAQFRQYTSDGCCCCGEEADPRDSGLLFTAMNQFFCGSCVENWSNERNVEGCL